MNLTKVSETTLTAELSWAQPQPGACIISFRHCRYRPICNRRYI